MYAIDPKTQGPSDGITTCKKVMGIEIKKEPVKKSRRLLKIGDDDDLVGFEYLRHLEGPDLGET